MEIKSDLRMYGWPVGSGNAKHLRNEKNPQKNEFTTKFSMWILNNRTAFDCDTEQHGSPMRTNSHRIRRRRGRCARWKKMGRRKLCWLCLWIWHERNAHAPHVLLQNIYADRQQRQHHRNTHTHSHTMTEQFRWMCVFFFNSFVNIYSVFKANAHFKVTAVCLINETKTKKEI